MGRASTCATAVNTVNRGSPVPAPLSPEKREAIADAIREGKPRNAIAREHEVSGSTVTKIGKELEANGDAPAFDRSQTKKASEARVVDLAAWRTRVALRTAEVAEWLLEQPQSEQPVVTDDGVVVMVKPCAKDIQHFLTAYGIAVDKVDKLTRDDSEGMAAVDAWLKTITGIG